MVVLVGRLFNLAVRRPENKGSRQVKFVKDHRLDNFFVLRKADCLRNMLPGILPADVRQFVDRPVNHMTPVRKHEEVGQGIGLGNQQRVVVLPQAIFVQ